MANLVGGEEQGLYFAIKVEGEFSVKMLSTIRRQIEEATNAGHTNIAFDLSAVSFIDSSGLGLITNAHKKMKAEGGGAYVVAIPPAIRETIETSSLRKVVPCFASMADMEKEI